jgi:tetratricopeptide (TPR) repeat protein
LVEKVVRLAENFESIALIGTGGIGKTSVALAVLHHNRIKERFGENRRFIRCDQFSASRTHLLARLSAAIGAGVENPEDLTPLRPFLSSKEMLIILDNAESILDTQVTNAQEIRSVVEELCQFKTISLLITSRVTTVPRHCKRPKIPTLSMEAACDIFYGIYGEDQRSSIINDLLRRLDFHALSITLLATTASYNTWDYDRLAKEWDAERAQVLQIDCNESLAATIELSLSSPTFRTLGPNARDLLGVVAFFPQGVDEKNLDWLFPTISNRKNLFDKFCVLSLTYRSNGFVTMLSPIRDYLGPRDPQSSPLLCATRDRYFGRLSVDVDPHKPGFKETRWIMSEDVNVEQLLDVFTSVDQNPGPNAWGVCGHFMEHLWWHKPRQTVLGSKIEALPEDDQHKPRCLLRLSQLFQGIGNYAEEKRLLTHTLELERRRGDNFQVAQTLRFLSETNRLLDHIEEGVLQVKAALEIFEQIGDTVGQGWCLNDLAWILFSYERLDAAEDAASRAIDLLTGKGQETIICQLHRVLGSIHQSKREKTKAIQHFETALAIASLSDWYDELFWAHHALAELFLGEAEFHDASAQIERAKSYAVGGSYKMGRAMNLQARVWYRQGRVKEANSEALRALEIYKNLGASADVEICAEMLQFAERIMKNRTAS